MTHNLLPCPFCARPVDKDLIDTLYPTNTYWREDAQGFRWYVSLKDRKEGDGVCYQMNCTECNGGCGAKITADSMEEVIAKWNRRALPRGAAFHETHRLANVALRESVGVVLVQDWQEAALQVCRDVVGTK